MLKREIIVTLTKEVVDQAEADAIKEFVRQKAAERPGLTVYVTYHNTETLQEGQ